MRSKEYFEVIMRTVKHTQFNFVSGFFKTEESCEADCWATFAVESVLKNSRRLNAKAMWDQIRRPTKTFLAVKFYVC